MRIVAGKLQGEIALYGNAHVRRAAGIVAPAAIRHLLLKKITGRLGDTFFALTAQKSHEQNVFRFEDGITLKLAAPMAVARLLGKQATPRSVDRVFKGSRRR